MPVNKSAQFRFEILDECLRNGKKKWSKVELLRYVNRRLELHLGYNMSISASQIGNDLRDMQSLYGAPIEKYKEGRSCYYRYENPTFSIRNIPVEEEDIKILNSGIQLLKQMKGFPIANEMDEIVKRLESRYEITTDETGTIISFEANGEIAGVENIEDIYHAILRKNVLKISYQPYNLKEPHVRHVHPYFLKEYDERWYLIGYCEEIKNIRVFGLDRMKEIKVVNIPFQKHLAITAEDYFKNIIGVTVSPKNAKIHKVHLACSSEFAPYIESKPLHSSQKILHKYERGAIDIELQLIINPELINKILSFGKRVKVLEPASLAEEIHKVAKALTVYYAK